MLDRVLIHALPALALFVCVWATRVFLAVDVVALFMRMSGLFAIASVAVVGGLLPSLVLGVAFGLIHPRPVLAAAFRVAAIACALELGFASLTVPWWSFITWWVLPTESLVVLLVFPAAAWVGARLITRTDPVTRRRIGIGAFAAVALCAVALALLHGCLNAGTCGIGS
jgi:hypothetical protein